MLSTGRLMLDDNSNAELRADRERFHFHVSSIQAIGYISYLALTFRQRATLACKSFSS